MAMALSADAQANGHSNGHVNGSAHGQSSGSIGVGTSPAIAAYSETLQVLCGPLLNYRRMTANRTWHGSVLLVTKPTSPQPSLRLEYVGRVQGHGSEALQPVDLQSTKLYEDTNKTFWRFFLDVPIQKHEVRWQYSIVPAENDIIKTFVVPSLAQSFRIMFHSCNGFSVGTDVDAWSGPALWNDVLRMHEQQPFHVMIGGGDQIYNDGVRVDGPLREWTDIANPKKRRNYPFSEELRRRCDEYYFNNYTRWYGAEPFKSANAVIPQLNIWDDHDIIDGFGSYTDHFMRSPVFRGIGGVAHKYYLLFQHHSAPPKSTFTTDAPQTTETDGTTTAADPRQLADSWVLTNDVVDSCYIMGPKPGPYVEERSRSMYCQLGAHIAFAGIDARTERTRHQINYPQTYDLIFNRLDQEMRANPNIKHLILLLGVPIAYPRLQWLENILTSPIIGPLRLLNKRFGLAGGLFNKFDGQVDLLDDLDDHYTARAHKHERRELVQRLQEFAKAHSIRVSILGGDVHLGAIGRFFSSPRHNLPAEQDWRYMPNIISSAITNKPPPTAVANLLARRNKIHHLDHDTDETLLEIFNHDPGLNPVVVAETDKSELPSKKSADANHTTMPSRNYAIITESHYFCVTSDSDDGSANDVAANGTTHGATNGTINGVTDAATNGATNGTSFFDAAYPVDPPPQEALPGQQGKHPNTRLPMHAGERNAGTNHPAASGLARSGLGGSYGLDVTLRVEISNKDPEGHTEGYGFSIPALDAKGFAGQGTTW